MPTAPRISVGQTQVGNLPGARLEAFDTSAGTQAIARGLQSVAGVAEKIGQQEREKAETAQLLEADRRIAQWEIDTLYKPGTGLLNARGKDALGAPDKAMPEFDKLASEVEQGLRSDTAKLRFRQMVTGRRGDIEKQLSRHVAQQSDFLLKAEAEAHEQTALANIAVHAGDPERVALEMDRGWAAKWRALQHQGMPPEAIKAERQVFEAAAHTGVVDQFMARGEYQAAVDYFHANRDALGASADEVAARVRQAELQIAETREGDRIIGTLGTGPAAMREARKIEDPFVRERVEARIDQENARRDRLEADYHRQVRQTLLQRIELGQPLSPADRVAAAAVPGLITDLDTRARQIAEGVEPVRDDGRYYELVKESIENPLAFARRDLMAERTKLDNPSFDRMIALQQQVQKSGAEAEALSGYRTVQQVVDGTMTAAGLDPTPDPNKPERAVRTNEFRKALDARVLAWKQQNGGKDPGTAEVQAMADQLLMPWTRKVEGLLWDSSEKAFAFEAPKPPRDAASRVAGQVYSTPKGAMTWTGTGWVPVKGEGE